MVPKGRFDRGAPPHYALPIAMTSTEPPPPGNGKGDTDPDATAATAEPADRVGALRGAGVGTVDTRRLAHIVVGLVVATLAVLVVVFTLVGVHKNQQTDRLHDDGVPVTFTISSCTGLLGGSGSNFAGYVCHGSYGLSGHTYREQLPGNDFHRPYSTVPAIAVPGDPALVSPAAMVRTEHSSGGVFIVPAVLLVVLLLLVGLLLLRRRKSALAESPGASAAP
jgi:MYXO-CTERM domain-containing protein